MTPPAGYPDRVDAGRVPRIALLIGAAALVLAIIGAFFDPAGFFRSYLWSWLFWLGLALGSMGVCMVHHLSGGAWGFAIRRILEAAGLTLPLLALLFLPILLDAGGLFPWVHGGAGLPKEVADAIRQKAPYLNLPFFTIRAIVYFIVWIGTAYLLRRWSLAQDQTGDPAITNRFQHFCGPALILQVVTVSLAAVDWMMSLEPRWYSTIFGMLVVVSHGLTAFAFANFVAVLLLRRGTVLTERAGADNFWDLGSLMLAFLLLWAYMAFSQFLIIWNGDIADEVIYYTHRMIGGWQWVGTFLIFVHFFLPFVVLIFGGIKRRPLVLAGVAAFLFVVHMVEALYLVKPSFGVPGGNLSVFDLLLPLGIGGLVVALFARHLARAPLIPRNDPRLLPAETGKEATANA